MGLFSSNKPKVDATNANTTLPPVSVPSNVDSASTNTDAKAQENSNIISSPKSETIQNKNYQNNTTMNNATNISQGTVIEGQIKVEGDIVIDGHIKGTINCKSKFILSSSGKIDGDIICNEAEISGTVVGKILVSDMLILKGSAKIDGDIQTGKLVMESGVQFNGKCSMGGKPSTPTATPPPNNSSNTIKPNGVPNTANSPA
jgi:cytoskeletal protein CcmA (bactofilin family)